MHKIGISIFTICAFVASSTAHAHGGHGVSFMAGMAHPLLGFDHLLAMLGMGVSVAALGVRARWFAVALVGMALFVGAFSTGAMQASMNVAPVLAATLLMLALIVVRRFMFSTALHLGLLSMFTFFHGFAHGMEAPVQALRLTFMSGVVLSSLMLFALGLGLGRTEVLRHIYLRRGFGGLLGITAMVFLFGA